MKITISQKQSIESKSESAEDSRVQLIKLAKEVHAKLNFQDVDSFAYLIIALRKQSLFKSDDAIVDKFTTLFDQLGSRPANIWKSITAELPKIEAMREHAETILLEPIKRTFDRKE